LRFVTAQQISDSSLSGAAGWHLFQFEPQWQQHLLRSGAKQRQRERGLGTSEIMTILVAFHRQGYRNFKTLMSANYRYSLNG
jgi:hypothetical protein